MSDLIVIKITLDTLGAVAVERSGVDNEIAVRGLLDKASEIVRKTYADQQGLIQPVGKLG